MFMLTSHTRRISRCQWLLLLFPVCQCSIAQLSVNIDSLRNELKNQAADTTRINILNDLSYGLLKQGNHAEAGVYATDALLRSQQSDYRKGKAYGLMNLGMLDKELKDYASAVDKYVKAENLLQSLHDTLGLARLYHKMGNLYFSQQKIVTGIDSYIKAIAMYEKLSISHTAESNFYRLHEMMRVSEQSLIIPDYEIASKYSQKGYELAEQLGDKHQMAYGLFHKGSIDYDQKHYSACIPFFLSALRLFQQTSQMHNDVDMRNISWANFALGLSYSRSTGNIAEGLKYYNASKKLDEEMGDERSVCITLMEMGFDLSANEYYTEALAAYLELLTRSEKMNDKSLMATTHRFLGDLFQHNKNYDMAEKHYHNANTLFGELGNRQRDIAFIYHKTGLIQIAKGNREEAILTFQKMKLTGEAIKDTHMIAVAYTNLFELDATFENYQDILPYFLTALKNQEKKGMNHHTMDTYRFTGRCYSKMGDHEQAEVYFLKSLELAKNLTNSRGITYALLSLKQTKIALQDYEKALAYAELLQSHEDSLKDDENRKMLSEMKGKYETETRDKEILRLQGEKLISELGLQLKAESIKRIETDRNRIHFENEYNLQQVKLLANEKELQQIEAERKESQLDVISKENEIQKLALRKGKIAKNYLLGGFGLIALLSILVRNNYVTRQKLKLQTLRNKIASDLHDDVGSTLSSISIFAQMARQASAEVNPMLESIGEHSRKMLDAMADIVWTIHPENDQMEKIVLRMRSFAYELLGARQIDFEFDAEDNITQLKLPMDVRKNFYLIFKEATNNLVKYANADQAHFELKTEKNILSMTIRDNGKGFDPHQSTAGNGLKNMKKRAEDIGGSLHIDSTLGNGTTIAFKVAV